MDYAIEHIILAKHMPAVTNASCHCIRLLKILILIHYMKDWVTVTERRNRSFWAISSFVTMFSKSCLLQRRQKRLYEGRAIVIICGPTLSLSVHSFLQTTCPKPMDQFQNDLEECSWGCHLSNLSKEFSSMENFGCCGNNKR